MSRTLEKKDGEYVETILDVNECAWLFDDVCCNHDSPYVADFPYDHCESCPYFKAEDGMTVRKTV